MLIGGKVTVVCGYGDVGKGCAESLRGQGARVIITEIDPICALQAAMDGYQVATLEDVVGSADIFITATGNRDIITAEHMSAMKHQAIVGNIGHFDNEIDMAGLARLPGVRKGEHQAPGRRVAVPRRALRDRALRGTAAQPGERDRPPEFRYVQFVHQPGDRAGGAVHQAGDYPVGVYTLPKHLDEKVARLHLDALGVRLTELTKEQASYLGDPGGRPLQARALPLLTVPASA